jgi:hypothetical protein
MIKGFCTDCVVLSAVTKTTDKNGMRTDTKGGIYTHHVLMTDIGKPQSLNSAMVKCGGSINPIAGFDSLNLINMGGGLMAETPGGHTHSGSSMAPKAAGTGQPASPWSRLGKDSPPGTYMLATGALLSLSGAAMSALGTAVMQSGYTMPGGISVFVGTGPEGTPNVFTANSSMVKSGYYVQPTDKMHLAAEVINYDSFTKEIYLSIEYEYLTGRPEGYLDVSLGAINVDGCAKSEKEAMGKDPYLAFHHKQELTTI